MVQQERARATRSKILLGAAEVIRQVGYANATLAEISDTAGVTRGALYFHFSSKEDIAHALVEEQHRLTRTAAEKLSTEIDSPTELMMRLCMDLAGRLTYDPIVRAGIALTTDTGTFSEPLLDPYQDWLATFEQLVTAAQAAGEMNDRIDPATLSRFIIPSFTGIQLVAETFSGRKDLPRRIEEMWRVLIEATVAEDQKPQMLELARTVFAERIRRRKIR